MIVKKLVRLSYRHIVAIGFIIITSLMIATSYFSVTRMNKNSDLLVEAMNNYGSQTNIIRQMSQACFNKSGLMIKIFHETDNLKLQELKTKLNTEAKIFSNARKELIQKELDKSSLKILSRQYTLSKQVFLIQDQVFAFIKQGQRDKAKSLFFEKILLLQKEVMDRIEDLSKIQEASAHNSYQRLKAKIEKAFSTMMAFDLISIIFATLLAFYIIYRQRMNENKLTSLAQTDVLLIRNLYKDDMIHL